MSAIRIGEDLIHYEVLGRGRPVILVHGWLGCWRYWVPTMEQLHLKYRVYALDLYGFGDSVKNPHRYSLDQQVKLLASFMDALAIAKAAIIGHGLGALVAAEFARQYPDKVPRLLLVSVPLFDPGNLDMRAPAKRHVALTANPATPPPPLTGGSAPKPEPEPVVPNEATIVSASAAMRKALEEAAKARANGEIPPNPPELRDLSPQIERPILAAKDTTAYTNQFRDYLGEVTLKTLLARCFKRSEPAYDKLLVDVDKTDDAVLRHSISDFDAKHLLDTLRVLPMPVVLIHGSDDLFIPQPSENVWNYLTIDNEDYLLPVPLEGVRHFPMLEYERFFRLVNDFLETADVSKLEIKERWKRRTR